MQVATYDITGVAGPVAELVRDRLAQLWLNSELVLAASVWGAHVGLTLTSRIVRIGADDYWQLLRTPLDPPSA